MSFLVKEQKEKNILIKNLPPLKVRPEVEITLEKGNTSVEGVVVLLVQEMIYTCNINQEDELSKKEVQVMGQWSSKDRVEPGESRKFDDVKILIAKDLPITGFPHLDLIDVGYYIHAVAKVSRSIAVEISNTTMFLSRPRQGSTTW